MRDSSLSPPLYTGSIFDHCLWLGNQETFGWNSRDYTGSYSGALVMALGHSENEMTVENCTIALNLSDQTGSGSGITVRGGRLNLRNSIVAGNLTGNYCTGSRDLTVLSGASADVSYTLFSSNDVSSVSASVVPGAGVLYGDPVLVTRTADAKALVSKSGVNVRFAADKLDQKILVPYGWAAPMSGVKGSGDHGYYRRRIAIPADWSGKRVFVVIGASDCRTTAYVDGERLNTYEGGYLPQEYELTPRVKAGEECLLELQGRNYF